MLSFSVSKRSPISFSNIQFNVLRISDISRVQNFVTVSLNNLDVQLYSSKKKHSFYHLLPN